MCIFSSCGQIAFGSIMVLCLILTGTATFYGSTGRFVSWDCLGNIRRCDPWESRYVGEMRTVAIFMCLAIVFEIICLAWNFITFCACCWKRYIIHPLIVLSFITTALLSIAIIVYATTYKGHIGEIAYQRDEYGVSFWLAVSALFLAVVDMIVATMTVCLGERGL